MCQVYSLDKFRQTGSRLQSKLIIQEQIDPERYSGFNYDQMIQMISNRFGDQQPQGGVVYETPVQGMKLDSYGRGCVHNSVFQYRPKRNELWNRPMPFPSNIHKIRAAFEKNSGKVMVLGYKSDPFMWMDHKYCVTKEVLRLATLNKVQLVINTMSDLCAHDDYLDLITKGNHSIVMNMSLNDGNDQVERLLSPGAPSFRRRQQATQKLRDAGVDVSVKEFKELVVDKTISRITGYGIGYVIKPGNK